jgi:hypothetical protein
VELLSSALQPGQGAGVEGIVVNPLLIGNEANRAFGMTAATRIRRRDSDHRNKQTTTLQAEQQSFSFLHLPRAQIARFRACAHSGAMLPGLCANVVGALAVVAADNYRSTPGRLTARERRGCRLQQVLSDGR